MGGYKYEGRRLTVQERKERMKTHRSKMTEQDPLARARNFDEVNMGYDAETAIKEAERCLLCPSSPCVKGCPVNIRLPEFLEKVAEGNFMGALEIIKADNALPAITGRVCPQEIQCEGPCTRNKVSKEPVGIGHLERYVADLERKSMERCCVPCSPPTGKKVAVVGSGPGGLTVAADMMRLGHEVHIYEAFHKPGGVLVYGIPEFRLPKAIVEYEIKCMEDMGLKIHTNHIIGRIHTLNELLAEEGFDAIYIGIGAGAPRFMGIEGENLLGIFSANEYLTRSNLMKAYDFPNYDTPIAQGKNVCVMGGGNVAMDSVRTGLRLGAEEVHIIYRRSREELPARIEEVHHAEEEGVIFDFLTTPIRFIGDDEGKLCAMECIRMELGEPDDSGRRRPVPLEGSNFKIDTDLAVIAIGAGPNPILTSSEPEIELNRWGYIVADDDGRTSKKGVWAGGDIVTGSATVILAMGAGRIAATSIHKYLIGEEEW